MKSFFFIITVVLIICRPFFAVFDYAINYEKIVTELCINRDRPEITCNGVCYLKNQISKTVNDDHSDNHIPSSKKTLDFFIVSNTTELTNNNFKLLPQLSIIFLHPIYKSIYLNNLLDPPISLV